MDFDPDNAKWQCCCCRIPTGLKIMGLVEAVFAVGVMAIALHLLNQQAQIEKVGLFLHSSIFMIPNFVAKRRRRKSFLRLLPMHGDNCLPNCFNLAFDGPWREEAKR
jgi:hypothetical protein